MSSVTSTRRAQRRVSWSLLAALVPMLTFMGHWPTAIEIPGTSLHVSLPLADEHAHAGHDDGATNEESHGQHCHSNSAGCSDVPSAAGVSFAALNDVIEFGAVAGMFLLLTSRWWRPNGSRSIAPALMPPRSPRVFA